MEKNRKKYFRDHAITCKELLKGITRLDNAQTAVNDLSDMILELTNEVEPSPSQVLTAEEVLKKCLLKWCPEKERPDFEKDWKGRVDNDVFNAINEAMQEYSTLQTQQLQSRVKELEEALKPFSELAEACWADQRERKSDILYQYNTAKITFNDLLKAKESLKK